MTDTDKKIEETVDASADVATVLGFTRNEYGIIYPPAFKSNALGLQHVTLDKNKQPKPRRIGDPLDARFVGVLEDGSDPSIVLVFKNKKGMEKQFIMPWCDLVDSKSDWAKKLAKAGYIFDAKAKPLLFDFLSDLVNIADNWKDSATIAVKNGWYNHSYVLGDKVFGDKTKVVPNVKQGKKSYSASGTFEGWKAAANLAKGNDFHELSLCFAGLGAILKPLGFTEGTVFHLFGNSTDGKSTAQRLAASFWTNPEKLTSWNATEVGRETQMAAANHNMVTLDEFKTADARNVEKILYMSCNGTGKVRATKNVEMRELLEWLVAALSSGEKTLEDKLAEANLVPDGGAKLRMPNIPVSKAMYHDLHGYKEQKDLVDAMKDGVLKNYGWAGPKFIEYLAADNCKALEGLVEKKRVYAKELCPENASAQVARTTDYFAAVMVAADLYLECGLIDFDCKPGIKRCYKEYLDFLPTTGDAEEDRIVKNYKEFMYKHARSRFAQRSDVVDEEGLNDKVRDCVGIWDPKTSRYYFYTDIFFNEVCKTSNKKLARRVLIEKGLLVVYKDGRDPQIKTKKKDAEMGKEKEKTTKPRYICGLFPQEDEVDNAETASDGIEQIVPCGKSGRKKLDTSQFKF